MCQRAAPEKVSFDPNKATWRPSVLPGHIVLVSTVNERGEPNVAPKSWITMVALRESVIAFGCTHEHATYRNIVATGAFVVNIPSEPLVETIWSLIQHHGAERLRRSGLTLMPASTVAPPLVAECRAHLECALDDVKHYGSEVLIFGRMVAASIDRDCIPEASADPYLALRPVFFLEDGTYGAIDSARRVGCHTPTAQRLFVVEVGEPPRQDETLIHRHLAFLRGLQTDGLLVMAGPFDVGDMYALGVTTCEAASAIARCDPLVLAGAPFAVRAWTRTF